MIWADRVAVVWAAFIVLLIFAMWASVGQPGGGLMAVLSLDCLKVLAVFALPVWLFLRVLAFAFRRT